MFVERDLIDLERQYWQALKDQDAATAMKLSDEPCIIAGAQGVSCVQRKALAQMMASASYTLDDFELSDDTYVRMLGEDIAIVAYKVTEHLTVEGQKIRLEASDASTWIKRDGGWVCALHTESLAGDPFGRARQP
jgi:hypothetical protein